MDLLDRLKAVVSYSNLSDRAFALKCGLKQPTLDKQLKGLRSVSLETIIAVGQRFPEISSDWLLYGVGEMLRSESKETERINAMVDTITLLQDTIRTKDDTIKMLMKRIEELEKESIVKRDTKKVSKIGF